jgi:uncharacterized LabA/DUF88 family protein
MVDRAVVSIDSQNTYRLARSAFHGATTPQRLGHVHPLALGRVLVKLDGNPRKLVQVRAYTGIPDGRKDPRGYSAASRQVSRWSKSGVKAVTRPLRYPYGWPNSAPGEKPEEKGIDVALAIDFVMLAIQDEYDVGVLVSCDTDLRPALETVLTHTDKRVQMAAWDGLVGRSPRLTLPNANVWCHWLTRDSYNRCSDDTDYGAPQSN